MVKVLLTIPFISILIFSACSTSEELQETPVENNTLSSSQSETSSSQEEEPEPEVSSTLTSEPESDETEQSVSQETSTSAAESGSESTSASVEEEIVTPVYIEVFDVLPEQLPNHEPYELYVEDENSEYVVHLLFTADGPVKNLSFVSGEILQDDQGELYFNVLETLFTPQEFSDEMSLVIGTVFYGSMPSRAIVYEDEYGEIRIFTLGQSGLDGSVLLVEEKGVKK